MNLIQEIADSYELCYPDTWWSLSIITRARVVAKTFVNDGSLDYAKQLVASKKEMRRQKLEAIANRKVKKEAHWRKMHNIVMKAEQFYGDIVYEYCGGGGGDQKERDEVFAKIERGEFDEEVCRREALFTAFGQADKGPEWYDNVIKFWNKQLF